MCNRNQLIDHIQRNAQVHNWQLLPIQEHEYVLLGNYQQIEGYIYLDARHLPLQAKTDQNLIIIHEEFVEFWQQGGLQIEAEWDQTHKIKKTTHKFIHSPVEAQKVKVKFWINQLKKTLSNTYENINKNIPTSIPFHQATERLTGYARKFLNPQTTKKDIWLFALQWKYFAPFLEDVQNFQKIVSSDWVLKELSTLADFLPSPTHLVEPHILQQAFSPSTTHTIRLQSILQTIAKAFRQTPQQPTMAQATLERALSLNQVNPSTTFSFPNYHDNFHPKTFFTPCLADYCLAKLYLPETQSFWVNTLCIQPKALTSKIFQTKSLEATIHQTLNSEHNSFFIDLRTIQKESFERGYQKYNELTQALIQKELPQLTHTEIWVKWLIWACTQASQHITALLPYSLAYRKDLAFVRKWLVEKFGSIHVYEFPHKECLAIQFSKQNTSSDTNGKFHLYQLNAFTEDKESISEISFEQMPEYWISNKHYLSFEALWDTSDCIFQFTANASSCSYQLDHLGFDKKEALYIRSEAHERIKAFYAKQLGFSEEGFPAQKLIELVKSLLPFSKQLPALHKIALKMDACLPKPINSPLSLSNAEALTTLLEQLNAKINRLGRDAKERRNTFASMLQITHKLQRHLTQLQADRQKAYELLTQITPDSIAHYVYGILHHPTYQDRYQYWLHLPDFPPRIPLLENFWKIASSGEKLLEIVNSAQTLHDAIQIEQELPLSQATNDVVLKLDKQKRCIWADDLVWISNLPEKAWEFKHFGKSQFPAQFKMIRQEASSLEEALKSLQHSLDQCIKSQGIIEQTQLTLT